MVNSPRIAPFEAAWRCYEAWFARHESAYLSEPLAARAFVSWSGIGLEIGVGTGRFAAPLRIRVGIDPSPAMLAVAAARGIAVVQGAAENLPFHSASFDHAILVTMICFVEPATRMLAEAHRVLKPNGQLVIGRIDRDSKMGQHYLAHQAENAFYRQATFYSAGEVEVLLRDSGFAAITWGRPYRGHWPRSARQSRYGRATGSAPSSSPVPTRSRGVIGTSTLAASQPSGIWPSQLPACSYRPRSTGWRGWPASMAARCTACPCTISRRTEVAG